MFVKYDIFLPCIEFFLFCILPDMGYNECPVCKALPDMGCNECPVCLASELVFSELMLRAEANDAPANIFQVTVLLVNLALKVGVMLLQLAIVVFKEIPHLCWRFLTLGQ